jgi:hypothetical protein
MPFEPGSLPEGAQPFQPGQSGNPSGRPKGTKNMSTILREMLELEIEVDGVKMTQKDAIVKKLIKKSNSGNLRAIQEIFDRTEGKAKQEFKIDNVSDLQFNVKIAKPDG